MVASSLVNSSRHIRLSLVTRASAQRVHSYGGDSENGFDDPDNILDKEELFSNGHNNNSLAQGDKMLEM
jgi:hypothetical protein